MTEAAKLNFTIQDNIGLLEAALKHSIEWSMQSRRPENGKRKGKSEPSESGVEIMNCRLADESHVRSFISRFLIELNRLMGMQWSQKQRVVSGESNVCDPVDESLSDRDSLDTEEDSSNNYFEGLFRYRQKLKQVPSIKINGKYCGVYNIGGQTDDDDELYENLRHCKLNDRYIDRCAYQLTTRTGDDDIDDGYRSLSRSSARISMLQQLRELKSNLIDLLREFEDKLKSQLSRNRLDAYNHQRDYLISMIDKLIDDNIQIVKPETVTRVEVGQVDQSSNHDYSSSFSSTVSSLCTSKESKAGLVVAGVTSAKSENNISTMSGYEEQEHVIDYSKRRASADSDRDKTNQKTGSVAVDVNLYGTRGMPIDFGAMMRDYERKESAAATQSTSATQMSINGSQSEVTRQVITQLPPTVKHISSSSSTSEQSSSSNTSSSSFL